jgi:hypothetical protein
MDTWVIHENEAEKEEQGVSRGGGRGAMRGD